MKLDLDRTMQLFALRAEKVWARTYNERAERLIAEGRMKPSGLAAIEAGKISGLWDASDPIDDLVVPQDLRDALDRRAASGWSDASAPSYRRNVLRFMAGAKRAETRAKRTGIIADHAARGEKVPQY